MDAPTEWTYGGKIDWTSIETLKLAPLGMVLRTINAAIYERCLGIGIALLNPLDFLSYNNIYYHCNILRFSGHFINCNKTITDENTRPYWKNSDIEEALGEELISINRLMPISADWAFQQYKIINLMKWRYALVDGVNSAYHEYVAIQDSYSDAIDKFPLHTQWGPNSGRPGLRSSCGCSRLYGEPVSFSLYKSPEWMNTSDLYNRLKYYVPYSLDLKMTASVQIYVYWSIYENERYQFWDGNRGYQKNKFGLLTDVGNVEFSTSEYKYFGFADFDLAPPPDTWETGIEFADFSKGFNADYGVDSGVTYRAPFALLKFDGENGFKFRDW